MYDAYIYDPGSSSLILDLDPEACMYVIHTMYGAMHNEYIVRSDASVVKMPLYQLQGHNRIPMYFDQNWGIKRQIATGAYLRENHKFRV